DNSSNDMLITSETQPNTFSRPVGTYSNKSFEFYCKNLFYAQKKK
ncbi:2616_t:CDS:1, partial [Funneliformis mosseae]